jgi:hypothetical protein
VHLVEGFVDDSSLVLGNRVRLMAEFRAYVFPIVAEIDFHLLFGWDVSDASGFCPKIRILLDYSIEIVRSRSAKHIDIERDRYVVFGVGFRSRCIFVGRRMENG